MNTLPSNRGTIIFKDADNQDHESSLNWFHFLLTFHIGHLMNKAAVEFLQFLDLSSVLLLVFYIDSLT
jgi:hypothetical protein